MWRKRRQIVKNNKGVDQDKFINQRQDCGPGPCWPRPTAQDSPDPTTARCTMTIWNSSIFSFTFSQHFLHIWLKLTFFENAEDVRYVIIIASEGRLPDTRGRTMSRTGNATLSEEKNAS
jgi:hypothetical protein